MVFLSTVAPGCLIWYWFRPEVLTDYDFLKIAVLSLALTLPVLILNIALISVPPISKYRTDVSPLKALIYGALVSFVALYLSLLLVYFLNLCFKVFLLTVAIANAIVLTEAIRLVHRIKHTADNKIDEKKQ